MRIWIDGQCLQSASRYRGIGRYVYELIRSISYHHPEIELQISFNAALVSEAMDARERISKYIKSENIFVWEGIATDGEASSGYTQEREASELFLAHHVACLNPDFAFSVSPLEGGNDVCVPLVSLFGHNIILCSLFYDAIPLQFPDQYLPTSTAKNYYTRRVNSYESASIVFTISDYSNYVLRSLLEINHTVPIYAGLSENFKSILANYNNRDEKRGLIDTGNDYFLYVGGLDWRKNVSIVAYALANCSIKIKRNLVFVVAGDTYEPEQLELKRIWAEQQLPAKNLKFTGRVNDEDLIRYYKNAVFSIQPSLLEGFGLTALESIACDVPILTANTGALPEIVPNKIASFSPRNPEELGKLITKVYESKHERDQILSESKKNAANYSWKATSERTISSLRLLSKDVSRKKLESFEGVEQISKSAATTIELDTSVLAYGLAIATPLRVNSSRLLIEVTSTTRTDHGSGIQRVVKSIADEITKMKSSKDDTNLIYLDSLAPPRVVNIDKKQRLQLKNGRRSRELNLSTGDTVLMLDSSWEFHKAHQKQLNNARVRGAKVISTLYDLVPLRTPAFCDPGMPIIFSAWFKSALDYSDGFVCISKAVADNLIKFLEAMSYPRELKVGYWHLGANFAKLSKSVETSKKDTERKKFLMVGTIEPRKGHRVALRAFEKLWEDGSEDTLTIVGRAGWNTEALQSDLKLHKEAGTRLYWHDNADDNLLAALYSNADALITASFAEGFGLPIIEAASLGKPVIASDIPVFREVAAGCDVEFFEVGSSESLKQKILNFKFRDPSNSILSETASISWRDSAERLCEIITEDKWYYEYSPKEPAPYEFGNIGDYTQDTTVSKKDQKYSIALVEEPAETSDDGILSCRVRLRNGSNNYWSSQTRDGKIIGSVKIGCRVRDLDGVLKEFPNNRTEIPLILVPDMDYFFTVNIPKIPYRLGRVVEIELLQEGIAWWGNGLKIQRASHSEV